MNNTPSSKRPLSVPHLVFGLFFLGISAVWAIGQATNADLGHTAVGFPAVLIVAGIVGLVAAVAGSRQRRTVAEPVESPESSESSESSESEVEA